MDKVAATDTDEDAYADTDTNTLEREFLVPLLDSFVARPKLHSKLLVIVHIILKDERYARVRKRMQAVTHGAGVQRVPRSAQTLLALGSKKSHRRYGIAHGWTSLFCLFPPHPSPILLLTFGTGACIVDTELTPQIV